MAHDRRKSEKAGRAAERLALWYLRLKGWRLLAERYKCSSGEVDLIMRRGEVTAFIEVKARGTIHGAIESVSPRQAKRISSAARHFLAQDRKAALQICRFDIVAMSPYHWPRHIPNAFDGDQ
jgi:putative endonuclease